MSINQGNRKRLIRSPKPLIRKLLGKNQAVQSEYQVKFSKQNSKKEGKKILNDLSLNKSQRSRSDCAIERRLSFKKQAIPPLAAQGHIQSSKDCKKQTQQQVRAELALAIEYSEQGSHSKQNAKGQQNNHGDNGEVRRRIRRIKSNGSILINRKQHSNGKEIQQELSKIRKENKQLKERHFMSLKGLNDLEIQYAEQKATFEKEQQYYQRKIQALRRKIQSNKLQIGHIFTYKDFDAARLNIRPIVEVEGESSIVKSLLNSTDFKQLHQFSRFVAIPLADYKQEMTQATGPVSRQSCKEIDFV